MNEPARPAHNPWLSVGIVCLAQLMVVLDATIVNVALPSIQHSLKLSPANLQWVVNAYTLTFGGFLLLGGRMADLFGRRRLFFVGVTHLHGGVVPQRHRRVLGHADRLARAAGLRCRDGLAGDARDRQHHLPGGG